jgi:hypothetical protein
LSNRQHSEGFECCIALSEDIPINSKRPLSCLEYLFLYTHTNISNNTTFHFLHKLKSHTTVPLSLECPGSKCLSPAKLSNDFHQRSRFLSVYQLKLMQTSCILFRIIVIPLVITVNSIFAATLLYYHPFLLLVSFVIAHTRKPVFRSF